MQWHLSLLHELQQGRLHAATTDISANPPLTTGGQLVDLIKVDDAVLGKGDVAVRLRHEITHQIIDIGANVTGFAELGGIGLDEGHTDELGDVLHQVGFANAGRSDNEHILLAELGHGRPRLTARLGEHARMVVVIANRGRQHLLGFVLANHKAVEVGLDLGRAPMEFKGLVSYLCRCPWRHGSAGLRA